jgi:hypothetical protein
MILATHGIIQSSGAFESEYLAILNYATTQGYTLPSLSQRILQNKLVKDLKAAGVWSKLDTFSVFATDGNSDFALIDWKRLSQYTAVNSPTFTTNGGFAGNGTSSYIDTNFNPSIQGVNYTLNNAGRYFWVDNRQTVPSSTTIFEGAMTIASTNRTLNSSSPGQQVNQGTASNSGGFTNWATDGFKSVNRTSSNDVTGFADTTQTNRTATSTSIANSNQSISRGSSSYSTHRFRFYGMGASLVAENTDLYNALNQYLTSI